jgi:hypothetical protein
LTPMPKKGASGSASTRTAVSSALSTCGSVASSAGGRSQRQKPPGKKAQASAAVSTEADIEIERARKKRKGVRACSLCDRSVEVRVIGKQTNTNASNDPQYNHTVLTNESEFPCC